MTTTLEKTAEATRKTISLKFGGSPTIKLPERSGVIVPKRGKASVGHEVTVVRKPPRLKPRVAQTEADDVFSGFSGGSQRHIRRPKK